MYKHKLPAKVARHLGVASEDPMMRLAIRGIALWILALAVLGPGVGTGAGERRESAQEKKEPAKKSSEAAGSTASSAPLANPKDVQSLNAMVAAIYDVISGPPGARDWNRFHSLFAEGARLIAVRVPKDGGKPTLAVMTPKDYEERAGKHFLEHGFFEHEIGRKTDSFGMMTHITRPMNHARRRMGNRSTAGSIAWNFSSMASGGGASGFIGTRNVLGIRFRRNIWGSSCGRSRAANSYVVDKNRTARPRRWARNQNSCLNGCPRRSQADKPYF
jgi:hypothetical protein